MNWTSVFLCLFVISTAFGEEAPEKNEIPPHISKALRAPEKVILFSLEPWEQPTEKDPALHRFKVLGSTELDAKQTVVAIQEFETAVGGWDGAMAMCFDPRQAIQVTSQKRVYDLLICYECQQLYIYENNSSVAQLGVAGSPKILKELLTKSGIPLSQTEDTEEEKAAEREKTKIARNRWEDGMPKSIKPIWDWEEARNNPMYENPDFKKSLERDYPEKRERILVLFSWFGSGEGPWTGYGTYESVAENLLLQFDSADLVSAASEGNLDEKQTEGAARLFAGWEFSRDRPEDQKKLPATLSKKLLDHTLKSPDEDKQSRAKRAFSSTAGNGDETPPSR
jgi:hypothetical protein